MNRFCDLVLLFFILPFLLLPMLVLAIFVKATSQGPVLHWSARIGRNNKLFQMPKYRSMHIDTPQVATHLLQNSNGYITPLGSWLRSTSLDELPQLYSIFVGNMTFVGPRPALFNQNDLKKMRTEKGIHKLKPGLTGLAQINGRDDISLEDKVALDLEYLRKKALWFDILILWRTAVKVIKRDGISH